MLYVFQQLIKRHYISEQREYWSLVFVARCPLFRGFTLSVSLSLSPVHPSCGQTQDPPAVRDVEKAAVLLNLGDSVTTDHISPAGSISRTSPAARYLSSRGWVWPLIHRGNSLSFICVTGRAQQAWEAIFFIARLLKSMCRCPLCWVGKIVLKLHWRYFVKSLKERLFSVPLTLTNNHSREWKTLFYGPPKVITETTLVVS